MGNNVGETETAMNVKRSDLIMLCGEMLKVVRKDD